MRKEALFYRPGEDGSVHCRLCPHGCFIEDGSRGFCGVRVNNGGVLYAETYGAVSSYALDPVEKKPLYHFHPGSMIFSIGSYGCNLRCAFCQNHSISMAQPGADTQYLTPAQMVTLAERLTRDGNIGIAYTYNEPLIAYEFVLDCAAAAHEKGLENVLVTNGYIQPEPLEKLLPYIDALNIDLKAYNNAFYQRLSGNLEPVKTAVALAAGQAHVEVTTLVVPGENDSEDEIEELARFIAGVDPDIPLHLSRFFPRYQMAGREATPKETILRLRSAAKRHLRRVYAGNMGS